MTTSAPAETRLPRTWEANLLTALLFLLTAVASVWSWASAFRLRC